MAQRVGFIGVGTMGRPMARHVLEQAAPGDVVVLHNSRQRGLEALLESGARWADTAAEVARQCDIVVYMVPTIADIRASVGGPEGLLAGVTAPLVLVVSSTCSSQDVRALARDVGRESSGLVSVVDAPVSGGQEGAEAGTLSIMVGGDPEPAGRVVATLAPAGRPVHLGPLGAGQVAKACNQLIVAAEVVALAEAAVLAERSGLDVAALFDLLRTGYSGSRVMEVKAWRFAQHDYSPSGPARFMIKDLRAFAEEAENAGMATYSISGLQGVFQALTDAGYGDLDTAVVQRFIEDHSR